MAKARSTLVVALLFLWTAVPVVRCMIPGETLSPEERACCQSMGGQCGDSPAADHPCCKHATSSAQPALASAQATFATPVALAASLLPEIHPIIQRNFVAVSLVDPSPPPLLQQANPVLRI